MALRAPHRLLRLDGAFHNIGSESEAFNVANFRLPLLCSGAVVRFAENGLQADAKAVRGQPRERHDPGNTQSFETAGNSRLIVGVGNGDHRHTLRQRLEGGIQAGMGDRQRRAAQHLELWREGHDNCCLWQF